MAKRKITQLNQLTEISDSDLFLAVDVSGNETKKATIEDLKNYIGTGGGGGDVTLGGNNQFTGTNTFSKSITGSISGSDGKFATVTADNYIGIRESMILANFAISSFNFVLNGETVEVGETKSGISFTVSANRTPTTVQLTDNYGTSPLDLGSVWTEPDTSISFSSLGTFTKNDTNETVTFTVTAAEGGITSSKTLTTQWTRYFYWGKSIDSSPTLDPSFVRALQYTVGGGSALNTGKSKTFTVSDMSSHYAYFSYPVSYGALSQLKDNNAGFPTGFTLVGVVPDVTTENGEGNSADFYLYRTTNALNGTISFTTS